MGIGGKKKVFLLPPSHITQRHRKPSGYTEACHGVARQGEDGRTHLAQTSQTGLTGLTGLTQAPRSRAPQTAVAIKQAYPIGISSPAPHRRRPQTAVAIKQAYPCGISSPAPQPHNGMQTLGLSRGAPLLSIWSIRSTWSISKRHAPAASTPPLPSKKRQKFQNTKLF